MKQKYINTEDTKSLVFVAMSSDSNSLQYRSSARHGGALSRNDWSPQHAAWKDLLLGLAIHHATSNCCIHVRTSQQPTDVPSASLSATPCRARLHIHRLRGDTVTAPPKARFLSRRQKRAEAPHHLNLTDRKILFFSKKTDFKNTQFEAKIISLLAKRKRLNKPQCTSCQYVSPSVLLSRAVNSAGWPHFNNLV